MLGLLPRLPDRIRVERPYRPDGWHVLDASIAPAYPGRPMTNVDPARPTQHDDADLPPRPERPDCCAGGCATCVLDGYFEDVRRWEIEVASIQERRRLAAIAAGTDAA
jgi:hypothetical protein